MKIITISGHAQNGKDTVAEALQRELYGRNYAVVVTHYADLLKYICKAFFDWDGKKDEHGRRLLQFIGTDVIRKKNPDFWVNFVSDIFELLGENWDFALIPDARFPNEIDRLRERGFDVTHLRVVREGFSSCLTAEQKQHASETALDGITPDTVIKNNGSLEELYATISHWIKEYLNEH